MNYAKVILAAVSVIVLFHFTQCAPVTTCPDLTPEEKQKYLDALQQLFPDNIVSRSLVVQDNDTQLAKDSEKAGTDCPTNISDLPSGIDDGYHARSICPWYLKTTRDPDRFPPLIYIAQKRCNNRCVGMGSDFMCEHVYKNITVLRRTPCVSSSAGTQLYRFEEVVETIPVSAVCAKKRQVVSSTQQTGAGDGGFKPIDS